MIKCLTAARLATEASALDLVDGKAAAALLSEKRMLKRVSRKIVATLVL